MPSVYENDEMQERVNALTDTINEMLMSEADLISRRDYWYKRATGAETALDKARNDIDRVQKLYNDLEYENEQLRKYIISLEMNNSIVFNKD
jgi:ElaB/YqjD/DUF883 family membrane-anchored ribosome-binding protein